MKGRALRRALATSDAARIYSQVPVPLIVDTTELITPDAAYALLLKNKRNRPINWSKVEEYAEVMRQGKWLLHAQGIVLDTDGNILTGQKRLWAVIYANVGVYMRVSRGNPPETARVLDRGVPQSARDLAMRGTGRKHSQLEASLVRGILALAGTLRPSVDEVAAALERHSEALGNVIDQTRGTRKTRGVLMILSAVVAHGELLRAKDVEAMTDALAEALRPKTAEECWGHGVAFSLAMGHAKRVVAG